MDVPMLYVCISIDMRVLMYVSTYVLMDACTHVAYMYVTMYLYCSRHPLPPATPKAGNGNPTFAGRRNPECNTHTYIHTEY